MMTTRGVFAQLSCMGWRGSRRRSRWWDRSSSSGMMRSIRGDEDLMDGASKTQDPKPTGLGMALTPGRRPRAMSTIESSQFGHQLPRTNWNLQLMYPAPCKLITPLCKVPPPLLNPKPCLSGPSFGLSEPTLTCVTYREPSIAQLTRNPIHPHGHPLPPPYRNPTHSHKWVDEIRRRTLAFWAGAMGHWMRRTRFCSGSVAIKDPELRDQPGYCGHAIWYCVGEFSGVAILATAARSWVGIGEWGSHEGVDSLVCTAWALVWVG